MRKNLLERPPLILIFAAFLFLLMILFIAISPAQMPQASPTEPRPNYVLGELVVKFKRNATEPDREQALNELDAQRVQTFRRGAEHWRFSQSQNVPEAVEWLRANPAVEYAHPNYLVVPAFDPNDPRYPQQWHLKNTGQNIADPNERV